MGNVVGGWFSVITNISLWFGRKKGTDLRRWNVFEWDYWTSRGSQLLQTEDTYLRTTMYLCILQVLRDQQRLFQTFIMLSGNLWLLVFLQSCGAFAYLLMLFREQKWLTCAFLICSFLLKLLESEECFQFQSMKEIVCNLRCNCCYLCLSHCTGHPGCWAYWFCLCLRQSW